MFQSGDQVLFVKRGAGSDYPGFWAFPGGRSNLNETLEECAEREAREEIGPAPYGKLTYWTRRIAPRDTTGPAPTPVASEGPPLPPPDGPLVDITTFRAEVRDEFVPKLNREEHTAYAWASIKTPPEPLHPGAAIALARYNATETDIGKMIVAGEISSPQRFENVTMFDLRLTGTGVAYRTGLDEHVYRPPEIYLTPEFLERCNGLPVIWLHPPKGSLDSKEFAKRIIGSITCPYIKNDEVWGIAKVWDDVAAREMEEKQLSTSPAVVFKPTDGNKTIDLDDGSTLLIEGKPSLLDHVAICEEGVWDKGGMPAGVVSTIGDVVMADTIRRDDDDDKRRRDDDDKRRDDDRKRMDE